MTGVTSEIFLVALIFGLLVVPRVLQRFLLPAPLTSFTLGVLAMLVLGSLPAASTLALLATLGISSLFLFAGLEVDLPSLRHRWRPLLIHLTLRLVMLAAIAWGAMRLFQLPWQAATLFSLALLTPSTGFILENLAALGLNEEERFWISSKAIAGELLALVALFGVLQADELQHLAWSTSALIAIILFLPLFFIGLVRMIGPYAPGSEFSLLVMVGFLAAYLTKQLGVYYLVGAFLAGLCARLLRKKLPALASAGNLHAVRLFASFFVPFYFFYQGINVPAGALRWDSLTLGLLLSLAIIPFRVGLVWVQRRFLVHEDSRSSLRVAVALAPTLIFTLVLATILRERFGITDTVYGALLVYAAVTTVLPSLTLRRAFELDATGVRETPAPKENAAEFCGTGPAA